MKHVPVVGEKLFLHTPCNSYWVAMCRYPYTVESVSGNKCIVREAGMIFDGPRYYDSLPVGFYDDPDGKKVTLRWSEKKQRWQESPAGGYPQVAQFGEWDYQPYLD